MGLRRFFVMGLAVAPLAGCVTSGPSPVGPAITGYCASPSVSVRLTDPDGLPYRYDDALSEVAPPGPHAGAAARFVEARMTGAMVEALPARFSGDATCALSIEVVNAMLPDRARFSLASGGKSLLVSGELVGPDGALLAQTVRGFTVTSALQRDGLGRSSWARFGETQALRAEALAGLADAAAEAMVQAFGGGTTQTGLSGALRAFPERVARE